MSPVDESRPFWRCRTCAAVLTSVGRELRCSQCGAVVPGGRGYFVFDRGFVPRAFPPERREHLAAIEESHFWFGPRRRLLEGILDRELGGREVRRALELGCGGGSFLAVLAERADRVVGVDAYGRSLEAAHNRAPSAELAQADIEDPPLGERQFDVIVLLDVLEHVDPDRVLEKAAVLAVDGAMLLVSVPAFPSLWSTLDEAAGHRVRYRLRTLCREMERAGWQAVRATHYQMLAFPFLWLARKFGGRRMHLLERRPPRKVSAFFDSLNSIEVTVLGRWSLPWGSSLIVAGRKI